MADKLNNFSTLLKNIFYDKSHPGSLGGREKLFRYAKKQDSNIKRRDVNKWLEEQTVWTLHKPARKIFVRNPVVAESVNINFQADLVDMTQFSSENNGFKYILTVIDVFSKKAWTKLVKTKTGAEIAKVMEEILSLNCPKILQTDEGKEFKNQYFEKLMKKFDIDHRFALNKDIKCSVVERFNKTLKDRIVEAFTLSGNRRYVNELDKHLIAYNNSYHTSIKMSPNEVNLDNSKLIFQKLTGFENKREYLRSFVKPKLKVGTLVRRKYDLKIHDRGYYPKWTDVTFTIYKAMKGPKKPYYKLEDLRGNILKKRFYPEEIQEITNPSYRLKILKQRKRKGRTEFFVKWLNHEDSENSWIPASTLTVING